MPQSLTSQGGTFLVSIREPIQCGCYTMLYPTPLELTMVDTITPIAPLPPLDTSTITDVEPITPEQLVEDPRTPPEDNTAGDGEVDVFQQGYIADCWFLASVGAVSQDADGAAIIDDSIQYDEASDSWTVTFKGDREHQEFVITRDELDAESGVGVSGDTDVRVMELAAKKYYQSLSEKNLIDWAGDDPAKMATVNELMDIHAKISQIKQACLDLWKEGKRSESLENQLISLQKELDDLISAQNDPEFSTWATLYKNGLKGGFATNAINLLTGSTLAPRDPSDFDSFITHLASDPDGATATVSCLTDPRTGEYWDGGSGSIGHVIYVTGFDAAAQTITLTDQNYPNEPFTMTVEAFKSWYTTELAKSTDQRYQPELTFLEIPNASLSANDSPDMEYLKRLLERLGA